MQNTIKKIDKKYFLIWQEIIDKKKLFFYFFIEISKIKCRKKLNAYLI
jgi:hypothetical protein